MFAIILFIPLVLAIINILLKKDNSMKLLKLSTIVYLFINIFIAYLFYTGYSFDHSIFFINFTLDFDSFKYINSLFILLISVLAFLILWYSVYYFKKEINHKVIGLSRLKQYNVFINLFIFAMLLVASTNNILVMWIALEATTIFTTFLISFYGDATSWEASWKYVILCSVGLTLGLFGILMLILAGLTSLDITHITFEHVNILLAKLSFIFIVIGFLTKVGLFPMNSWLPDAHGKASTPVSAFMSSILLPLALYIVFKLKYIVDSMLGNSTFTNNILLGFGIITLVYSGFILIYQKHFKRLLAYSSSENMGILALALGIGNPFALKLGLLHLIAHSFFKTASFMSVGNILLEQKTGQFKKIGNLFKYQKITSILTIFSVLMLAAIPISPLFISEIGLIYVLFLKNMYLAFIVIFAFILIFSGVLINFSKLFKEKENTNMNKIDEKFSINSIFMPILITLLIGILSIGSLLFIF